jgi:hypothetical protein
MVEHTELSYMTADKGRAIFRWITLIRFSLDHGQPFITQPIADEIDCNTARHDGVDSTWMAGLPAVEEKINPYARSSKYMLLEQHDKTPTRGNPAPTQQ